MKRAFIGVLTAACCFLAAAESTATAATRQPSVRVAKVASLGTVLVTATGLTLYHTSAEPKKVVMCTGMCAADWPPFLIPAGEKPRAGPGVRASLLGTIHRGKRTLQVTYAGMPLYRYSGDRKSGQTNGQGLAGVSWLGGTWYAMSPSGTPVGRQASSLAPAPTQPTVTLPGC